MSTAILVDAGFFVKRFRHIEPNNAYNGSRAAECLFRWAILHLSNPGNRARRDLYRIFVYDCPPYSGKQHHPITGKAIDFSRKDEFKFRTEFHRSLLTKRKVALRLGQLSQDVKWTIKPAKIKELLKRKITVDELSEEDVTLTFRQKGVDMRLGVDITSLALKSQVDQIVLISGDADFVPAAKIARREGIDFILDPMKSHIHESLQEHIDGLHTTCVKKVYSKYKQEIPALKTGDLPPS
ncbi:NYN domain-containing protein [Carnimonas nigrificans]|uniref:NYN domain-containing protein n=1 Tax=Carnimonas nigrificans TaxID=64323 RepID=UPI00047141C1|nr:NYN domain-containing protein [Carnimonas nigrificans]